MKKDKGRMQLDYQYAEPVLTSQLQEKEALFDIIALALERAGNDADYYWNTIPNQSQYIIPVENAAPCGLDMGYHKRHMH